MYDEETVDYIFHGNEVEFDCVGFVKLILGMETRKELAVSLAESVEAKRRG